MWSESLPRQVLVLTWDKFEADMWEAARNYAEEAGVSTKGGLNKYLRRAQIQPQSSQQQCWCCWILPNFSSLSQLKKKTVQSTENYCTCFERKEDVH